MHAVLAASDSLGPISKHYVPPPKKASRASYDSDDYGGNNVYWTKKVETANP